MDRARCQIGKERPAHLQDVGVIRVSADNGAHGAFEETPINHSRDPAAQVDQGGRRGHTITVDPAVRPAVIERISRRRRMLGLEEIA